MTSAAYASIDVRVRGLDVLQQPVLWTGERTARRLTEWFKYMHFVFNWQRGIWPWMIRKIGSCICMSINARGGGVVRQRRVARGELLSFPRKLTFRYYLTLLEWCCCTLWGQSEALPTPTPFTLSKSSYVYRFD